MVNDDGNAQKPLQETITIEASEPAHNWTMKSLSGTTHGWHGYECQTCLGRYVTLTNAFDAGFQYAVDAAKEFGGSGLVVAPGHIGIERGST